MLNNSSNVVTSKQSALGLTVRGICIEFRDDQTQVLAGGARANARGAPGVLQLNLESFIDFFGLTTSLCGFTQIEG